MYQLSPQYSSGGLDETGSMWDEKVGTEKEFILVQIIFSLGPQIYVPVLFNSDNGSYSAGWSFKEEKNNSTHT